MKASTLLVAASLTLLGSTVLPAQETTTCDSREALADEIFEAAFAPVLNRHVEEGVINSWTWLSHLVGGKYRKILVYDAADYGSVLKYWNQLWGDVDEESPELLAAFSDICDSHTDYVWDLTDSQ